MSRSVLCQATECSSDFLSSIPFAFLSLPSLPSPSLHPREEGEGCVEGGNGEHREGGGVTSVSSDLQRELVGCWHEAKQSEFVWCLQGVETAKHSSTAPADEAGVVYEGLWQFCSFSISKQKH